MNKCPITYQDCGDKKYTQTGLRTLSPMLTALEDLPFTASEQRREAVLRAGKMSIQGVQAKLSAKLKIKEKRFDIVDRGGVFIIKPQSDIYPQLPENEDLTMKLAKLAGIDVPVHGLVYSKDGSLSYFIKRFDRYGKNKKYHQEDFAQLTGNTRDTKYNWSMEKLIPIIDQYCTFPAIEKVKLFRRIIFNFLVGNEDMHLKNFSLITRANKIQLSPAYDFLNTSIAVQNSCEELALPLNGKKNNLDKSDFIDYFGKTRLELNETLIAKAIHHFEKTKTEFSVWIKRSFLSEKMRAHYSALLEERYQRLGIGC